MKCSELYHLKDLDCLEVWLPKKNMFRLRVSWKESFFPTQMWLGRGYVSSQHDNLHVTHWGGSLSRSYHLEKKTFQTPKFLVVINCEELSKNEKIFEVLKDHWTHKTGVILRTLPHPCVIQVHSNPSIGGSKILGAPWNSFLQNLLLLEVLWLRYQRHVVHNDLRLVHPNAPDGWGLDLWDPKNAAPKVRCYMTIAGKSPAFNTHRIHGTGIFTYIFLLIYMVNVGKYTIHGWYGTGNAWGLTSWNCWFSIVMLVLPVENILGNSPPWKTAASLPLKRGRLPQKETIVFQAIFSCELVSGRVYSNTSILFNIQSTKSTEFDKSYLQRNDRLQAAKDEFPQKEDLCLFENSGESLHYQPKRCITMRVK